MTDTPSKPKCAFKLAGPSGNVYYIIGTIVNLLEDADMSDRAAEFKSRALSSSSYDAVLELCSEYVDVQWQ